MKNIILLAISLMTALASLAHVQLNNPSGGETFFPGDTVNIQWQELATHATENYDLFFSPDGGLNWEVIELDINPNHREYDWVVPGVTTDKGSVMVVQDNEGTDYSDDCDYFTIMGTSGIFDRPSSPTFSVFPNPAGSLLNIDLDVSSELSQGQIRLMNHLGQSVYEAELESNGGEYQRSIINTAGFSEGIYYLVIGNDRATETRKVIISR